MQPYYNRNHTREEVAAILARIKECVVADRYTIALNEKRRDNIDFITAYNLRSDRRKAILLQIEPEDFCHSLQNTKAGYEHEVLNVFVPRARLYNADGEKENVDIYTKFNILELPDGERTVVISFHKKKRPIEYMFR